MTDPNKTYRRFLELYRSFDQSPDYLFYQRLVDNRVAISILNSNFRELRHKVAVHNKNTIKEASLSPHKLLVLWRVQRELVRLISNYLSSMSNQIAYSRKILMTIKENDLLFNTMNNEKQTKFVECGLHRFIVDLRNFLSHDTHLKIVSEHSMKIEWDEPRSNLYIKRSRLLHYNQWSKPSKQFMEATGEKIYIFDLLSNHFDGFQKYQNELYLGILLANPQRTETFISTMQQLYNDCEIIGCNGMLPFGKGYLRYLNLVYRAARNKTWLWQNQGYKI